MFSEVGTKGHGNVLGMFFGETSVVTLKRMFLRQMFEKEEKKS